MYEQGWHKGVALAVTGGCCSDSSLVEIEIWPFSRSNAMSAVPIDIILKQLVRFSGTFDISSLTDCQPRPGTMEKIPQTPEAGTAPTRRAAARVSTKSAAVRLWDNTKAAARQGQRTEGSREEVGR